MGKKRKNIIKRHNVKPHVSSGSSFSESPLKNYPSFVFKYVGKVIRDLSEENRASLFNTLSMISEQTWFEIDCNRRQSNGYEKIPKTQFPSFLIHKDITEDETIKVFRFGRTGRFGAVRRDDFFILAYVDPTHKYT